MRKSILIIGGTGFIGYHLARRCLKKKWKVTSVSTNKAKKIRFLSGVKYLIFDISKKELIKKNLKLHYDYVVNLGGYVNHKEKIKTFKSHYIGSKNLADFFKKKTINSFIQIGSSVEYGKINSPQRENSKTNVQKLKSTYGKAKLMATNYLIKQNKKYNFPCIILRLYLVYGTHQDANRLVSYTLNKCLNNENFNCSEGKQFRDFLFVEDLITAIVNCFDNKKALGQIINIGSGKPKKIKSVILFIKNKIKLGKPLFGKLPLRDDEILTLYPEIKKAKKILNWKPLVSFNKGIDIITKYYKKPY